MQRSSSNSNVNVSRGRGRLKRNEGEQVNKNKEREIRNQHDQEAAFDDDNGGNSVKKINTIEQQQKCPTAT
jgi:hypothetical protein